MLLINASNKSGRDTYEGIAEFSFGLKWKQITSWSMIICLCGTLISYITLIKSLMPHILSVLIYGEVSDDKVPFIFS